MTNQPIPLSRKNRVSLTDLEIIRTRLAGNQLALDSIGSFLKYANSVLRTSENHCRIPHDQPRAQVEFGNSIFLFSRATAN
jgi:hypothetical protein